MTHPITLAARRASVPINMAPLVSVSTSIDREIKLPASQESVADRQIVPSYRPDSDSGPKSFEQVNSLTGWVTLAGDGPLTRALYVNVLKQVSDDDYGVCPASVGPGEQVGAGQHSAAWRRTISRRRPSNRLTGDGTLVAQARRLAWVKQFFRQQGQIEHGDM